MNKRIVKVICFLLLEFYYVYSSEVCPKKVVDLLDPHNIQQRFNNLKNAIGGKSLKTTFIHKRVTKQGGTKEEAYDYEWNLCGESGGTAVSQVSKDTQEPKIIGKFGKSSLLLGGEDWILLQYHEGDKFTSHCNNAKREAWISIRCEDQGETPTFEAIEEASYNSITGVDTNSAQPHCYYLFEYNHPEACSAEILKKLRSKNKLSGGAIFCIILFSFALTYLLFGFLYQRFIAHAKGWEQIPNFSFWKKVGNASADGCDYVCRREEHPNTYKGMADALDIDSSDDDKDDGLLPM